MSKCCCENEYTWCPTCECNGFIFVKDKTKLFKYNEKKCVRCNGTGFILLKDVDRKV